MFRKSPLSAPIGAHLSNGSAAAYNERVDAPDYVMKVSSNGQVSIPAATRVRWRAARVVVVDMGDYLIMRPVSDDPVTQLSGKYARRGPTSDQMRRRARAEEAEHEAHDLR